MSVSGALFDENKLLDVSKNRIALLKSNEVYEKLTTWAKEFDEQFYGLLTESPEYTKSILAIDRDNTAKPRKDLAKWNEAKEFYAYFFEETFTPCYSLPEHINKSDLNRFP